MALHELDIWNRALARVGQRRLVLEAAQSTSGSDITAADPAVVTITGHGYANGDFVLARGMTEMPEVNGRIFEVAGQTANNFQLRDFDASGLTAEATGGTFEKLPTTKPTKACFDAWSDVRDEVLQMSPWNEAVHRTRLSRLDVNVVITSGTAANPVVLTTAIHSLSTLDEIFIDQMTTGEGQLNNRYFTVTVLSTTTLSLNNEDGTDFAITGGGRLNKVLVPLPNDFGYTYRYPLPSDHLRMLEVFDSRLPWVVEGDRFLTDDGETAKIRYIRRVTDVTEYGDLLVSVLATRLALELVEEITQSNTKKKEIKDDWEAIQDKAQSADGQEQSPMDLEEDDWVLSRL